MLLNAKVTFVSGRDLVSQETGLLQDEQADGMKPAELSCTARPPACKEGRRHSPPSTTQIYKLYVSQARCHDAIRVLTTTGSLPLSVAGGTVVPLLPQSLKLALIHHVALGGRAGSREAPPQICLPCH